MTATATTELPPLSTGQTSALLDHVVYEQVLRCVDLDALYRLEQSLTLLAGELDDVGPDHAGNLAKAMLDRALLRLPDDMRRYLRAAGWMSCDGCEICEEEARHAGRTGGSSGPRRPHRPGA